LADKNRSIAAILREAVHDLADKRFLREQRLRSQKEQANSTSSLDIKPHAPVRTGRRAKRDEGFTILAGSLWRDAKGSSSRVSTDALEHIAAEFDRRGYVPPAIYLEKKVAESVKLYNRNHSNSKQGSIKTWADLVRIGDKDHLRGMRRLLSRCATEPPGHRIVRK
jgi:hypothetical protein